MMMTDYVLCSGKCGVTAELTPTLTGRKIETKSRLFHGRAQAVERVPGTRGRCASFSRASRALGN